MQTPESNPTTRACAFCGEKFSGGPRQIYCKKAHKQAAWRARAESPATVGEPSDESVAAAESETLAPFELSFRGARLWDSLLAQDEQLTDESHPMREVALSACRTADRVEQLERTSASVPHVIEGKAGPTMHPVLAEVRQQAALLARLVAALRLPDEASGKRPQRRQVRGVQLPAEVRSARDRLRAV